ncbi:unnamed protein product, partial [marine sediment metagenome]
MPNPTEAKVPKSDLFLGPMCRITANLAGRTRYALLNERQHLVAPITLIVPGVLNGSQGALYYPPEEVKNSVAAWNYMPLVVYHPKLNGM